MSFRAAMCAELLFLAVLFAEVCIVGYACTGETCGQLLLIIEGEFKVLSANGDAVSLFGLVYLEEFAQLDAFSQMESHSYHILSGKNYTPIVTYPSRFFNRTGRKCFTAHLPVIVGAHIVRPQT